jgi:hypothetical protein
MLANLIRAAALLLAVSVLGPPAFAQEPSPSHIAAAQDLVNLQNVLAGIDQIPPALAAQIKQANITRPELAKDLDEVLKSIDPDVQKYKTQLSNTVVKSYAKFYTEDELKGLVAFFKSPLGAKFLRTQSDLVDEVADEITAWSQQISEFVVSRTRAEMAKRGLQMQ